MGFLERVDTQNLENFGETAFDFQFFPHNRNEQVNADCDPDLSANGIGRRAVESVDSQMLFDPFEKQFDLPTALVELRDQERRQHKVVRQEHKPFAGFDVEVMNSPQRIGIRLRRLDTRQHNRLIAAQAGCLVDDPRLPTLGIEVLFWHVSGRTRLAGAAGTDADSRCTPCP